MGVYTNNNRFYKPALGASGQEEKDKFDEALDGTDQEVTDQRSRLDDHSSRHESGGADEITHNSLDIAEDDHHTRYTGSEAVSAINAEDSLDVNITGDADTVDGSDVGTGSNDIPKNSDASGLQWPDTERSTSYKLTLVNGIPMREEV